MNNVSVGIITFHKAYSYGAAMQCYALQKVLKSNGLNAQIIDYSMAAFMERRQGKRFFYMLKSGIRLLKEPYRMSKVYIHDIKRSIKQKKYRQQIGERNKRFEDFWNKEYTTNGVQYSACSQIKRDPPQYDAYICGSDQIWNPGFCDMDDNYYLEFAPIAKRIAYAPSLGVTNLKPKIYKILRSRVENIPYLSFREETMRNAFKMPEIPIVIDPTFLLKKDEWERFADKAKVDCPKQYIMAYFIGDDKYAKYYVDELKRRYSVEYKIINVVFDYSEYGPYDFVKLLRNAKYLVTNSFHGMALAIKMNVPFCIGKTLKDISKNSGFIRMESLLEQLGINNRVLDMEHPDYGCLEDGINFQAVNQKIEEIAEKSYGFLINAINLASES